MIGAKFFRSMVEQTLNNFVDRRIDEPRRQMDRLSTKWMKQQRLALYVLSNINRRLASLDFSESRRRVDSKRISDQCGNV